MEYRTLPHGGELIGVVGMGTSSVGAAGVESATEVFAHAIEQGVNYFDFASADAAPFSAMGDAAQGARGKLYYQVHFGANYETGSYGWTCDLDAIKRSVDWQLGELRTDYIDFGFIHCIDEGADLKRAVESGVVDHIKELKKQGVVRHVGLSTHTPAIAGMVLDMGIIDMLMFSINAAYDYRQGEYANGTMDERAALYRRCAAEGVGISVMKAFAGGQLLDAKTSPFGVALTEYQCLQYVLDKPGVVAVLPGVRDMSDLDRVLGFFAALPQERDYAVLSSLAPQDARGICVYCNHCQPCPQGVNVGLANKYYDLARAGDALARDHYANLEHRASECVACGHCSRRCPFGVDQASRMREIAVYFGA